MQEVEPKEIVYYKDSKGNLPFKKWLYSLDTATRARIDTRIQRVQIGNYGDYKNLQNGVKELRFKFGSGYRIYFAEQGNKIVILLCGGDKSSQIKDIKKAIEYLNNIP